MPARAGIQNKTSALGSAFAGTTPWCPLFIAHSNNSWLDAIFSVANYLKQHGFIMAYSDRLKGIHVYNSINNYVNGVIKYADKIWQRIKYKF